MNRKILLLISLLLMTTALTTEVRASGPFRWGNATYVNLALREPFSFGGSEVELLAMKNHYNRIRVDHDTAWIGVSFRSPAVILGNLRIFVADNKNVAALSSRKENHGLLEKDALVALSPAAGSLVEAWDFSFPVSFTGGYLGATTRILTCSLIWVPEWRELGMTIFTPGWLLTCPMPGDWRNMPF